METETRQLLKQETVSEVASTWTICVGVWTVPRAGGNGMAGTAMGEKWRRLDSNLNLRNGMFSSSASP